jgi:arginase family enzyme
LRLVSIAGDCVSAQGVLANNYPSPGGPSAQDVERVLLHLKKSQKIAAVSISTWNPMVDSDQRGKKVGLRLL